MMRALIIENSRMYRQLLDNIFGQHGFENDIGDSLKAAHAFVDSEDYDIICINKHLKDGLGLDFVDYCNKHKRHRNTAILFLTSDKNIVADELGVRVDRVITKINLQQILDQITRFIDTRFDPLFSEGRILFIEDSKTVAAVIMGELGNTGYRVSHFNSADEAWKEFENEASFGLDVDAYDLILTDINLQGKMSGKALVSKVRALLDARGYIPIIAITGDSEARLRLSLYQLGVNDFIQKPVMPEELLVRIGNLITNKRLLDRVHDIRRELFVLATTDQLTGCQNRRSLMDIADKFISQARRDKYPVSVLVTDLDQFKKVNDNFGHAAGDVVLEAFGQLLNKSFCEGDVAARFGGEEFVVLLSHCGEQDALVKAERLRTDIEALKPDNISVTCSIGVTTLEPGSSGNFETMFSAADKGVYLAKEKGRNQSVFVAME